MTAVGARAARAALAGLAALLVCAAPACAHPFLIQSAPAAETVAAQPPRAVTLSFTEEVTAAGATVRVRQRDGRPVPVRRIDRSAPTAVRAELGDPPPPGIYTVDWSVRGDDGHNVSGSFGFGVPRGDGSPPAGVEKLGAPGLPGEQAAAGESALDVSARWLGIVAVGVTLAGGVARRRARSADERRWRLVRAGAFAVGVLATAQALVAGESLGEPAGKLALVRLAVLVAAGVASAWAVGPRRFAEAAVALGSATALVTYALEGHVQTVTDAPALWYVTQAVHVLAAGIWAGGLVVLATGVVRGRDGVRAFAPIAAAAVALLAATGVAQAVREVDEWFFLRWSAYGRVVIAKAALLVLMVVLAALTGRALRRGRPATRSLRLEAGGALGIVLLAALLASLPTGRGQLLPAQRGNLLAGASFATVSTGSVTAGAALGPASPGSNTLVVTPMARGGSGIARSVRSVRATLRCLCGGKPVEATLRRGDGGAWSARVELPARGTWLVTAAVDGRPAIAPAALAVGDPRVKGSTPARVLMTADLSGRDALRCRAAAQGALLAIGRLDARGGLPGGRKVTLAVEDDRGDPGDAAAHVRAARGRGAVALLAPCGAGAAAAVDAADGLPAIVADPAVPVVEGRNLWRSAGDPAVEGSAIGQYLAPLRSATGPVRPQVVAAVTAPGPGYPGAASAQRLDGLRRTLERSGIEVRELPLRSLRSALSPRRHMAAVLDGDPARIGPALAAVGARADAAALNPAPIVAASPLLDERLQVAAGVLGRTGAIASPAEVVPGSADARLYAAQQATFFRGDRPSLIGLRGYVAGLALGEGLRDGPAAADVARRLRRPRPFTDALVAPWRATAPSAGAPLFAVLSPRFLSSNLLPPGAGGEAHSGAFFDDGAWTTTSTRSLGLTSLMR